jgi:hypothetical protein
MPGTKTSGRPGGNPDITKYSFKTDREESCTAKLSVRIAPSDLEALKAISGWQELVRQKVKEILKENPQDGGAKD